MRNRVIMFNHILQWEIPFHFYFLGGSLSLSLCSGGGLMAYADYSPPEGEKRVVAAANDQKGTRKKRVVVLGTGWGGTSFLKDLDISTYDVEVVSPRNYFAFTPLLPSVTCGTVEARSIVEPVRNILKKVTDFYTQRLFMHVCPFYHSAKIYFKKFHYLS